ncbi:3-deoxy-manno-octulosonate cytidylyltransferase [Thiomicrospira microaerophila]|uniref:3-deoxy-manno-octulosonate cytidylyltransferase n=1 Tax=Thiomicrospira microaerophila TaxID=406020 RepID=UPI00200C254E|nr:3-deoxy-manno-octulosonate cytidylyltransferase [Thiomicrospira microaerophila]UQB43480.1 3-deoxy-manno-octulosonate cytidylyltransferase [Thiomicrospira microaerophila]
MSFNVIIPARLASTRLYGKPLLPIHGKPMIYWTWQQAVKSGADRIVIATESEEVKQVCEAFGAEVCLTGNHHQSGTERIAEVVDLLRIADNQILVNLQGDEPMLPPELIKQLASALFHRHDVFMATLCEPIDNVSLVFNPNIVKVSRTVENFAINFSRAPLPWARDEFAGPEKTLPAYWPYQRHIGLYAYRAGFVKRYVNWPECALEKVEKLEQLRVLWHGERILVEQALMDAGLGVDTQEQLDRVRQLLAPV